MNFYKVIFYCLSFIIIYLPCSRTTINGDLKVIQSGLDIVNPCSVGMQLFTLLNNTSNEDLFVELLPDECCLDSFKYPDCDSLKIIGDSVGIVTARSVARMNLVVPTLYPLSRKGFCTIHIDSRPERSRRALRRNTLTVNFDTDIRNIPKSFVKQEKYKICNNIDEDPLNNCRPVDCDSYYNGIKTYYDIKSKTCKVPKNCINKNGKEIYDPINDKCIEPDGITSADIDNIRSLVFSKRRPKDILIINRNNKDTTTSNYTILAVDKAVPTTPNPGVTTPSAPKKCDNYSRMLERAKDYVFNNKCTLIVLLTVLILQCCLIAVMISCLSKKGKCCGKKKLVRKFFNYRQDASVTTPLIGTSNMDTETTEFDYISESSNIEKKIRCYKACHKEHEAKVSMTDDILTKCLNRRDWQLKSKSENLRDTQILNKDFQLLKDVIDHKLESKIADENKGNEVAVQHKVTIDNDSVASMINSEKVLHCHDYNAKDSNEFRTSDAKIVCGQASISTEKGAQACFSNDTLDDFLSERGMVMFGDNMSFETDSSRPRSSFSDLSSRTSKNNFIKNFLSYLSRKSKMVVTSEPGGKKSSDKDLEIIHMSRPTVYSDSDSGYKKLRNSKMLKESRSTF